MTAWVMVAVRSSRRVAMSCSCLSISASIFAVSRSRKSTIVACSAPTGKGNAETAQLVLVDVWLSPTRCQENQVIACCGQRVIDKPCLDTSRVGERAASLVGAGRLFQPAQPPDCRSVHGDQQCARWIDLQGGVGQKRRTGESLCGFSYPRSRSSPVVTQFTSPP